MKKAVIGVLAHVDAGKTTLCEALLYTAGALRARGRVDSGDTCMDNHPLERARGITIFSQQATLRCGDAELTLLDTPGHVDFSPEMERTLPLLDAAVLVISGTDGVQAHTETLWRLLRLYAIPTVIFVTKMDLAHETKQALFTQLTARLSDACVDFAAPTRDEQLALCREDLLEQYLQTERLENAEIDALLQTRQSFACLFGSGLQAQGIDALLGCLSRFAAQKEESALSARVWKISYDEKGTRLTHLKLMGGTLRVKDTLGGEKINQLRCYNGAKYTTPDEVTQGTLCAVTGLTNTFSGQLLGEKAAQIAPTLAPVLRCRVLLPEGCDAETLLPKMKLLEQEEPTLHVQLQAGDLHVQLMGQVQTEVFCALVQERFGVQISLGEGRVLYRETIENTVEGVGHFEPLRHYAEVHLKLEPLPRGSGLQYASKCREDVLERNWQRLILTHLQEKEHLGVLTGAPITDMKITLLAGRAHIKHTEGGDFRQATYRAVRQGLMQAKSVLLEPVCAFRLELPPEQLGRAINDVRAAGGAFSQDGERAGLCVLTGTAPYAAMSGYGLSVAAYTRGRGRFSCEPAGYAPCRNAAQVIEQAAYDAQADLENTPDSVFCSHGAGVTVKWNEVMKNMHLEACLKDDCVVPAPRVNRANLQLDDKELEAIMEREFGPIKRPMYRAPEKLAPAQVSFVQQKRAQYLIVDGYNVVFAWDTLRETAQTDLEGARTELMSLLCNYAAYTKACVILIFDAYNVAQNPGKHSSFHNIEVVFTKENETADAYIERLVHNIGKNEQVRVVTSDALIQLSAFRSGVLRLSAGELAAEVDAVSGEIDDFLETLRAQRINNIGENRKSNGEEHGA